MNASVYDRAPRVTGLSDVAGSAAGTVESSASAVSWAAIFAGAFAAVNASVVLVALGSGFGFASISPWSNSGASLTAFAVSTGIWLIVVQWLSAAMGGYVTGRLRTKWVGTHTHEVFFRDTAHGFVTWAVATVLVAAIVSSAASSTLGAGARAVGAVASDTAQIGAQSAGSAAASAPGSGASATPGTSPVGGYDIDLLFRPERSATATASASGGEARAEATRILVKGLADGDVSAADRTYLAQLVAARTGLSQSDAETRVNDVIAQVKAADARVRQAADTARKAAAAASIFTALSLLIGAFIASVAAALGGRQRDLHP